MALAGALSGVHRQCNRKDSLGNVDNCTYVNFGRLLVVVGRNW